MFRPRTPEACQRRRAVILLIVLVLLTLFAIVGLAFVLYANMEANASRIYREALSTQDNRIDIPPPTLANYALGQLLFDVPDPTTSASPTSSALRGHSLNRDIYGWNSDPGPTYGTNIYAFNGVGRLHDQITLPSPPFPPGTVVDSHSLINYVPYPNDNFVRDPERLGLRGNLGAPLPFYTGGWNSSYTYPDGNHVYLGALDADGNVLARSFVRPYLVPNSPFTAPPSPYLPLNPADANYWSWFTDQNPNNPAETVPPYLRYASLRPRNKDMAIGFPPPGLGGDVKNLQGFPGPNDSVWIDLDYQPQQAADGTWFKPLFAFFIADLDGRVNINTAGNVRNPTSAAPPLPSHLSNQGWGKWEVNPAWLTGTSDWPQMLVGSLAAPNVRPRYGFDKQPNNAGAVAPPGNLARVYGPVDFDGSDDTGAGNVGGAATGPLVLPSAWSSFPTFPNGYNNGFAPERTNHPLNYDAQYPGGDDRRFAANSHLLEMYNGGPTSTAALGTDLGKLLPQALQPRQMNGQYPAFRAQNMMTTDSVALDVPGLTPWIYDRTSAGTAYGYGNGLGNNAHQPPNGKATAFPALTLRPPPNQLPGTPNPQTEFTVDWKSADAVLNKVDLNRFLSPYPHMGQGTNAATYSGTPLVNPYDRFDQNVGNAAAIQAQYQQAQADRMQLADDIYRRLLRVTSVPAPAAPAAPTSAELAPRRWLAQLAANIVDFIDEDEISTPFNFYNTADGLNAANIGDLNLNPNTNNQDPELPKYWVFGTELPKVVLNEVLAEYQTPVVKLTGKPDTTQKFPVRVFAELFNPMPSAAQLQGGAFPNTVQQQDNPANPIPLYIAASGANPGYSPYNVQLADTFTKPGGQTEGLLPSPSPVPYDNDNVFGTPNTARAAPVDADFGVAANVQTIDGKPATATIAPQQFFLLTSPGGADVNGTFATAPPPMGKGNGVVPAGTSVLTSNNMQYNVQYSSASQWQLAGGNTNITDGPNPATTNPAPTNPTPIGITVLLRRLANPHLPPNPNPLVGGAVNPAYNPYITIDYMQRVMPQEGNNTYNTTVVETSTAKTQPYASARSQYLTQNAAGAAKAPATVDTFGSYNNTAANSSYNWLVHPDRQLISAMELLNVSGYHPHELTNHFLPKTNGGATFGHQVNWYNESTRLYRAFEYLGTRDRASGVSLLGGRQPGKININAIWNKEILEALADPQPGNGFKQADVDAVFAQMMKLRSPNYTPGVGGQVWGTDRPFLGMGIGNMPSAAGDPVSVLDDGTVKPNSTNTGIEDTFLRSFDGKGGTQRLFDVTGAGATHPYQTTEMMRKIYGNVTTRSNVFAVWVTVGFFRVPTPIQYVDNQASGPVKVAEEIGAATGTNIRHRLFAVVDRSRLTLDRWSLAPRIKLTGAVAANALNQPTQVTVSAASGMSGSTNNVPWKLQVGSMLIIDNGTTSEETVVVQQLAGATITAIFSKAHAAGARVQFPGNPGPQPTWTLNARGYYGLVPTFTVMQ